MDDTRHRVTRTIVHRHLNGAWIHLADVRMIIAEIHANGLQMGANKRQLLFQRDRLNRHTDAFCSMMPLAGMPSIKSSKIRAAATLAGDCH